MNVSIVVVSFIFFIQSVDHLLLRKGSAGNVMVFPENDYNNSALTNSDGKFQFTHTAYGADMFRYSWNYGQNWTNWTNWEDTTTIDTSKFEGTKMFWDGNHIMVQCEYDLIIYLHND